MVGFNEVLQGYQPRAPAAGVGGAGGLGEAGGDGPRIVLAHTSASSMASSMKQSASKFFGNQSSSARKNKSLAKQRMLRKLIAKGNNAKAADLQELLSQVKENSQEGDSDSDEVLLSSDEEQGQAPLAGRQSRQYFNTSASMGLNIGAKASGRPRDSSLGHAAKEEQQLMLGFQ